jgi:hypothetical protein
MLDIVCFSQGSNRENDSLFLSGIQLTNPDYQFRWKLKLDEIPTKRFKNYKVGKQSFLGSLRGYIAFDSATFLNRFVLSHVIVKVFKQKKVNNFQLTEGSWMDNQHLFYVRLRLTFDHYI